MGLFDTVTVDVLSADFQTKQLGEGFLRYRLSEDGRLVAPCGIVVAYHGLVHLVGQDGAEFMAIFTHGRLETSTRSPARSPGDTAAWPRVCSGRELSGDLTAHPPTVRTCQRVDPDDVCLPAIRQAGATAAKRSAALIGVFQVKIDSQARVAPHSPLFAPRAQSRC
jgi:hypothetical protein